MPKDIRLIGHIATFRNVFEMIFLNHSYVVVKKTLSLQAKRWYTPHLKRWYDGQRIHFRSENGSRLLAFLREKPFATFTEIAEHLSVNRSAVQKQIEGFRKKGFLDRRDNDSWHVLAMNSRIQKS